MAHTVPIDWWRRQAPPPPGRLSALPGRVAYWGLLAFTIALIAAPQEYLGIPKQLRVAFLAAMIAIAANLVDVASTHRSRTQPLEVKVALALFAWAVVTIPLSLWPGGSVTMLTEQYFKSVAVFWVLGSVVSTVGRFRIFMWTVVICSVPATIQGLRAYLSGNLVNGRIVMGQWPGLTANPNDLALVLCFFLPLAAALALTARRTTVRMLAWGLVALFVAGVLVTFSRQGILVLVAEAMTLSAVLWRGRRRAALTGMLAGVALVVMLLPAGLSQRFATAFGDDADHSAQVRHGDQFLAFAYILSHPIVGAGLGRSMDAIDPARGTRTWTTLHNVYLAIGVDLGLVGLGLFLLLVGLSYRSTRSVERQPPTGMTDLGVFASAVRISLVGFMVAAFFAPIAYHFYFYYLAGLAVAAKETARFARAEERTRP